MVDLISGYKQAGKLILKNKWLYLLPLFSVFSSLIPNLLTTWQYQTKIGFFSSPTSLTQALSLDERIAQVLHNLPWTQAFESMGVTGLIGGVITLILFFIFANKFWCLIKTHKVLGATLWVSFGLSLTILTFLYLLPKAGEVSPTLNQGPAYLFYLFCLIIFTNIFSYIVSTITLGTFLVYIKNLLTGQLLNSSLEATFQESLKIFTPLLIFSLILTATSPTLWSSLWGLFANLRVFYTHSYIAFPIQIFYTLLIIHTTFILSAFFVPYLVAMGQKEFTKAFWQSINFYKEIPKNTLVLILCGFCGFLIIFLIFMIIKSYAPENPFTVFALYTQFLEQLCTTAYSLIFSLVVFKFILQSSPTATEQQTPQL